MRVWPLGVGFQERASNYFMLLQSKVVVVSDEEKAGQRSGQVWTRETNANEPLLKRRDLGNIVKTKR